MHFHSPLSTSIALFMLRAFLSVFERAGYFVFTSTSNMCVTIRKYMGCEAAAAAKDRWPHIKNA